METPAKTLKDTYGKQWSDDPALLKKLLNAGEEIIISHGESHLRKMRAENGTIDLNQGTRFGKQPILVDEAIDFFAKVGCKFLLPAPSVEPAPLEWHHYEDGSALSSSGDWSFYADDEGDYVVTLARVCVFRSHAETGDMNSAKAAIHEWRVNHLNSMIKK